jgi:hypothetical protein
MSDLSDYAARLNARARAHGELCDDKALAKVYELHAVQPVPITSEDVMPSAGRRVSKSSAKATERFALDTALPELQARSIPDYTGYYLSENKLWSGRGDTGFRLYRDGFIRPDGDHTQHYREKDLIYGPDGFQGFCFDEDWMRGPQPILPWNYQLSNVTAIDSASIVDRLNERARRRSNGDLTGAGA